MGIEDGEQTYDGTMEGVEAAARALTEGREQRATAEAREAADRPPPRQPSEAEIEARDNFRTTVMSEVDAAAQQAGLKLNSRAAGAALALLRQHEAEQAEQTAVDEMHETFAQEAAAQVQAEPPADQTLALARVAQREAAMEGARQQFEALSNELVKGIFSSACAEFADIKTPADVEMLAATDPARAFRFQQVYAQLVAAKGELDQMGARNAAAQRAQFNAYAQENDSAFLRAHPELHHPATYAASAKNAVEALKSVGISEAEILHAWRTNPLMRDHRVQSLLLEAGKQHAARESVRGARRAPVPQVQRPGVARDRHVDYSEVQQLKQKFGDAPLSVKDAGALLAAQRRARAR